MPYVYLVPWDTTMNKTDNNSCPKRSYILLKEIYNK